MTAFASNSRRSDLRIALRLIQLTIAWMVIEGAVALWLGDRARSLLLEAFGIDSVLELVSAAVLLWRLNAELLRGASEEETEHCACHL